MKPTAFVLLMAATAAAVAIAFAAPTARRLALHHAPDDAVRTAAQRCDADGKGDWRGTPACTGVDLRVEVRNVNLPNGTVVTLETCGRQWSTALNSHEARFEVRGNGPTCTCD